MEGCQGKAPRRRAPRPLGRTHRRAAPAARRALRVRYFRKTLVGLRDDEASFDWCLFKEELPRFKAGAPEGDRQYVSQLLDEMHLQRAPDVFRQILEIRLVFLRQDDL